MCVRVCVRVYELIREEQSAQHNHMVHSARTHTQTHARAHSRTNRIFKHFLTTTDDDKDIHQTITTFIQKEKEKYENL